MCFHLLLGLALLSHLAVTVRTLFVSCLTTPVWTLPSTMEENEVLLFRALVLWSTGLVVAQYPGRTRILDPIPIALVSSSWLCR